MGGFLATDSVQRAVSELNSFQHTKIHRPPASGLVRCLETRMANILWAFLGQVV